VLSLATLSNILSYSDTLLLTDNTTVEALGAGVPTVVDILRTSQQKPQGLYAAACIANASFHPRLASIINERGGNEVSLICLFDLFNPLGLQVCREVERQGLANLNIFGSRIVECVQTAIYRLSDKKEGEQKSGNAKFRCIVGLTPLSSLLFFCSFKWGTKPTMELSLASYTKHSTFLWICFFLWICVVIFTFMPLLFV
jgi:hypothetical protein